MKKENFHDSDKDVEQPYGAAKDREQYQANVMEQTQTHVDCVELKKKM